MEEKLSSRVICYYVDSRSMISQTHPDMFLDLLRKIGTQETLTLMVISDGGAGHASLRLATILREYCRNLQILVPSRCASAATMLCLAADKIIMAPSGYLTSIDSSLRHELNPKGADGHPTRVSVDQVKRVIKFLTAEGTVESAEHGQEGPYRTLFKYLHPLALGEIDRASSDSMLIAQRLMKMHPQTFGSDEQKMNQLAEKLINGYPAHGFPIVASEAIELGLPVEKADAGLSEVLRDLVRFYDTFSLPQTTHMSELNYHVVGFPVIIEAKEVRSAYRIVYDKRINSVTRTWQVENDFSRWVNITLGEGEKVVMQELDKMEPVAREVKADLPVISPQIP